MELLTLSYPVFTQLAGVIFEKRLDSVPQYARSSGLFKEEMIPANTGDVRNYTEIDTEEYADEKDEDDQASRLKIQGGYDKNVYPKRVAKNVGISYEMRTRNKYQDIIDRLTSLVDLCTNRMDLDLTHRLTFGAETNGYYTNKNGRRVDITTGDGLPLFYTAKLLKGSSTTYRNRLANNPQFSKGALENIQRLEVEETYNHLGEKVVINFDIVWSGDDPNTRNSIEEEIKSTASTQVSNSGVINVNYQKYRHVILPRLATTATGANDSTKRKYWGTASSSKTTAHLAIWEAPHMLAMPASGNNGEDKYTDSWEFGTRAGYGIGIVTGNWIRFSSGDATP